MAPEQFAPAARRILQLPVVATLQAKGHAVLLDAFLEAGFKWMVSVPGTLVQGTTAGSVAFQGGFTVRDPLTGLEMLAATTVLAVESSDGFGFCYYWEVTRVAGRKALRRSGGVQRLMVSQIRSHLLLPEALALYDEEALLALFTKVLSSLPFTATTQQAATFANRLSAAIAP